MRKCTLTLLAAAAALTTCGLARAGVYRTITIDGDVSDWAGIAPAFTDATGDGTANATTGGTVDYTNVYIANDANYLYFRFQLATPADPTTYFSNYFLNTDGNATDGLAADGGADVLIQGNTAYQTASGAFTDGPLDASNSQLLVGNYATVGTDGYEYRISRTAKFQYGTYSGSNVFTSNDVGLYLESENSSFGTADTAGPVTYTFATATPTPEPATLGALAVFGLSLVRRRQAGR